MLPCVLVATGPDAPGPDQLRASRRVYWIADAARSEGAVAKAAKRKIERVEEPSPRSLMARLAALQAEFAAKLQNQNT